MRRYLFFLLFPLACAAGDDSLVVSAECEGSVPHGSYAVGADAGPVRIEDGVLIYELDE